MLFECHMNIWIFKNYSQRGVFYNVSLYNLENVWQRNLRIDSAFLEHLEARILKFFCSVPTILAPSWFQCMYGSVHKNSGYITVLLSLFQTLLLWLSHCFCYVFLDLLVLSKSGTRLKTKGFLGCTITALSKVWFGRLNFLYFEYIMSNFFISLAGCVLLCVTLLKIISKKDDNRVYQRLKYLYWQGE